MYHRLEMDHMTTWSCKEVGKEFWLPVHNRRGTESLHLSCYRSLPHRELEKTFPSEQQEEPLHSFLMLKEFHEGAG